MSTERYIKTSHGVLALKESGRGELPVLLIHGNSSCSDVFRKQLDADLFNDYRLMAVDLPGHGQSEDATDADRTYTLPGLAGAVSEVLEKLGVSKPVVMGWSLGGHIAIEMLALSGQMRALLLCGTPPVGKLDGKNNMAEGFNHSPRSLPAHDGGMDESEARSFIDRIFREPANGLLIKAAMRTDGRFRRRLVESSFEGLGVNQRSIVETAQIPIAVINGAEDNLIKADFFQQVAYPDLWEDKIYRIEGAGHAPFWEEPNEFNRIFGRFLSFTRTHVNRP